MICENCKSEFNSLNWFRYMDKDRMVLCDNCLTKNTQEFPHPLRWWDELRKEVRY
jgi:protein-arginine kinase activator protein McsA